MEPVAQIGPRSVSDVQRRVIEVIFEKSDLDVARIDRATRFHELGDSLDRVEVVMKLEEEFELPLPDDDVAQLGTVGELVDYIFAKLESR